MRKVIFNKWFFLTLLLTISLSAFSVIAYQKAHPKTEGEECCRKPAEPQTDKGQMIFDAVSRQFTSLITIH